MLCGTTLLNLFNLKFIRDIQLNQSSLYMALKNELINMVVYDLGCHGLILSEIDSVMPYFVISGSEIFSVVNDTFL